MIGLMVLQLLAALAVPLFFRRISHDEGRLRTVVAPVTAFVLLAGAIGLVVTHVDLFTGASTTVNTVLISLVPAVFVLGLLLAYRLRRTRRGLRELRRRARRARRARRRRNLVPAPDLVLVNARVRTPELSAHTAVAVHDGLITAVGDATDARDWRGPGTETVDLGGATLTPGLTDSHSHPVWGLEMFTGTDLSAVRDLDQLRSVLAGAERRDGWILGFGLDHNVFGGRPIHRELIEDVLGDAPPSCASTTDTPPSRAGRP